MKCKKTLALVLAGTMLLPSGAFAADLSRFNDFPNDWSSNALEKAVDHGLLNGSNGKIDGQGLLTRAQMAAIVSRAFGATKSASLKDYRDMLPDAWYYNDMSRAVQMKAFQGADGLLHPDDSITREEAFVVLARAFALTDGRSASLSDFSDNGAVSSWASGSLSALVENGYVNGANGRLNPKNNITRAEFAKIITDMAASYADSSSIANQTVDGNLIVRADGASLSGVTVNGDLIIADGADKVSLDGVKVTGRIVIRGASTEASLKNSSAGKGVLVSNPNGAASLSVSGGSVGTVTAKSDLVVSGSVDNIVIAEKAALTVQSGASVGSVTVSAAGASVSGAGTVSSVQANANNVTVSTKNTKVTAASGVSGVKAGDKTVDAGKTGTVGTAPSSGGSSSGGGSSSSRSDYSYVLMNIPYDEFYKAELENNEVAVDAVSSATKQKTMSSLVGGSYHVKSDGTDITGVIYPVRVKTSDLSGLTQITDSSSVSITTTLKGNTSTIDYTGKDALFQSANHSYYYLSSAPSSYKEATLSGDKWTFGKATGSTKQADGATATLKVDSNHGDYKIKVEHLDLSKNAVVYGVALSAVDSEGKMTSYGLRHLENIWKQTKLAFSTGFVTESHGNHLSSEHYKSIMGKTINKITYFTSDGNYEFATDLYVPVKSADVKVSVEGLAAGAQEATLKIEVPSGFSPKVTVPEGMGYDEKTGKITFNSALPGAYEVTVSDTKGKYADVTASFTVSTSTDAAQYDSSSVSLKKADNVEAADFANFLKNITSVKVGDKEYDATDKDAVTIIKKDGKIDEDAKSDGEALFADGKEKTLIVSATGYPDLKFNYTPTYTYAYAAVPYDEYWKSEGVYLSGSDWKASSGVADRTQTSKDGTVIEEHDKGAFDAVSRATAIHGRHRGSFQQDVVINTTESKKYTPVYWIDADTAVVSTGDRITLNKDNIQDYKITGIKYVPVKVSASDFADFCSKYDVTKNGDTMQGGYSENNLSAYTDLVAAVDANTNGLKAVTKGKNGYTFGKRQTGTGSGIKNQALKIADNDIVATAKNYADAQNFGAHLRVDLTNPKKDGTDKNGKPTKVDVKNAYGALGDNMQTVVWKYYGNGNTVLATYGTKFAADNWMHKSMGIQLGLTDSLRFQLPEGTDGTGKWEITIYALGYSDSTFTVNMTADNVAEKVEKITDDQKTQLRALAARAQAYLDNANTKYTTNATRDALNEHAGEAADMLANADASKAEAASLIDELTKYLNELDEANASTKPTTKTVTGSALVTGYKYNAQVTVTFDSKGKVVSVVDNNTQPSKNSISYWNSLSGLTSAKNNFWEQFNGLDKAGVSALRIDPTDDDEHEGESNFDAVSGATYSSKAVQNAVLDAFNNLSNN